MGRHFCRAKWYHCLSVSFSPCGRRRGEQTLTPRDTKFQSTDSRVHNEKLGCSHFLPLFGGKGIGAGGCGPRLQGSAEGNALGGPSVLDAV